MFCENCGKQLPDSALFCDNCGERMKPAGQAEAVPVNQDVKPEEAQPASNPGAQPSSTRETTSPGQPQYQQSQQQNQNNAPPRYQGTPQYQGAPPYQGQGVPPYQGTPQPQQAPAIPNNFVLGKVTFTGKGGKIFFPLIGIYLLSLITLGIYGPWGYVKIKRFILSNTYVDGKQLGFIGTGGQLWGKLLVIALLSMITIGIYGPWGYCKIQKWIADNTIISDK